MESVASPQVLYVHPRARQPWRLVGRGALRERAGAGVDERRLCLPRKLGDGELQVKGRAGYAVRTGTLDASLSAGYTKEDLEIALTGGVTRCSETTSASA